MSTLSTGYGGAGVAPAGDPGVGLTGDKRDAYVAIMSTLSAYHLGSLSQTVLGFIQQGYSADTINILLQNTDAYKQRFSANEARRQAGLPVLSPAEYLATEQAYRQVMSNAGLPPGFYDQPDDFKKFLVNDMSPTELNDRVKVASDLIYSAPQEARDTFSQWYGGETNMVAYLLDPERAAPLIEKQAAAAKAGAVAQSQGVAVDKLTAENVASLGLTDNAIRQGFANVSALKADTRFLSDTYGGNYTQQDAIGEVFYTDQAAADKRKGLASQERAQFSGAAGIGRQTLGRTAGGQI